MRAGSDCSSAPFILNPAGHPLSLAPRLKLPFFLASAPGLQDPAFQRAVILLLDHDDEGGFGFVINQVAQMNLDEVVAFDEIAIPEGIPVWQAGPVDSSSGFVLHNQLPEEYEQEVAPGVCLSASQDSLRRLIEQAGPTTSNPITPIRHPYRLLVGYASWAPGQLDEELRAGVWFSSPLDRSILFDTDHNSIWESVLAQVGGSTSTLRGTQQPSQGLTWLH